MPPVPGDCWDLLERNTAPVNRRTSHAKARTGCVTCKGRRVKCDEGKPSCARCEKSGFQCAGYETPSAKRKNTTTTTTTTTSTTRANRKSIENAPLRPKPLLHRGVIPGTGRRLFGLSVSSMAPAYINLEDTPYFDRFRCQIVVDISVWCGSDYLKHILREAMHDECLRHAILATSAMLLAVEESGDPLNGRPVPGAHGEMAIQHYMKAISLCRKMLAGVMTTRTALTSLVTAFFFAVIEILQANLASADLILAQGVMLLEDTLRRKGPDGLPVVEMDYQLADIKLGFDRMSVAWGLCPFFQGSKEVYKTMLPAYLADTPTADTPLLVLQSYWNRFQRDLGLFMMTVRSGKVLTPEEMSFALIQQTRYLARINEWMLVIDELLAREKASVNNYVLAKMKAFALMATIFLKCFTDRSDLAYDDHLESFKEILKICQKFVPKKPLAHISFTLDMDLFPVVTFTVTKCRDTKTRQLALKTFTQMTYRQAFWNNRGLLRALRALVDLENQGRDDTGFIPAHSRYFYISSDWDQDRRQIMATFICAASVPTAESGPMPTIRVPIDF
ncbi:hypothetical protein F5X96DRAFT_648336 [Biscogniauxia mediterranea]|nr:hypothetical protein F5X96DRAFT_648336 [Biscogniauxia mediterranea]